MNHLRMRRRAVDGFWRKGNETAHSVVVAPHRNRRQNHLNLWVRFKQICHIPDHFAFRCLRRCEISVHGGLVHLLNLGAFVVFRDMYTLTCVCVCGYLGEIKIAAAAEARD